MDKTKHGRFKPLAKVHVLQSSRQRTLRGHPIDKDKLIDEARFLRSWVERPLMTGAVMPSGRVLARTMASYVEPDSTGPVIELGPGTGPVTQALVQRGIAEERLILVEFNPEFCTLLRRRFPKATVVQGDAYMLRKTLDGTLSGAAAATVSSLPLFTKPLPIRSALMEEAHDLMGDSAPFIQFTYALVPPIPTQPDRYSTSRSHRIWLNLPPARVWVYRRNGVGH